MRNESGLQISWYLDVSFMFHSKFHRNCFINMFYVWIINTQMASISNKRWKTITGMKWIKILLILFYIKILKKSTFKYWVYDIKSFKRLLFLNKFPDQIEIGLGRDFTEFNKWYLNYFSNAIFSSVWNV